VIVQLAFDTAALVFSSGVYRLIVSETGFSLCVTSPSEMLDDDEVPVEDGDALELSGGKRRGGDTEEEGERRAGHGDLVAEERHAPCGASTSACFRPSDSGLASEGRHREQCAPDRPR
jgi:hypothetical protein